MRLVKIEGIDLRRFEFDFDLTWYCFFLNADGAIYGRYGGRDATDAEARLSLQGLRYAMAKALETHQAPPVFVAPPGRPLYANDSPSARNHKGCIHCHNVNEFRRADAQAAGTWDRNSVWVYPLPENVGITLDVDVANRVKFITARSGAEKAGLRPGDLLTRLNGYAIASFADASYALHKAPAQGSLPVTWVRGGAESSGTLELAPGWRKTNLTWRPSMLDLLPPVPFIGDDLTAAEKKKLGLAETRAAFRQGDPVHTSLVAAGLQVGDVVIGFDGVVREGSINDLLGFVRRNYLIGETVTVDVLRDGKRVGIKLQLK